MKGTDIFMNLSSEDMIKMLIEKRHLKISRTDNPPKGDWIDLK